MFLALAPAGGAPEPAEIPQSRVCPPCVEDARSPRTERPEAGEASNTGPRMVGPSAPGRDVTIMAIWQGKSQRKSTGGRLNAAAKKRKFEIGREAVLTTLGEDKRKTVRIRGGHTRVRVLLA